MKMILFTAIAAAMSGNAAAASALPELNTSSEAEFLASGGASWTEVSKDVFEFSDSNGTTYRRGFGLEAAKYDLANLSTELNQLDSKISNFSGSADELANLESYRTNLQTGVSALQSRLATTIGAQSVAKSSDASVESVGYANGNGSSTCGFVVHQLADFSRPISSPGGSIAYATSSIAYVAAAGLSPTATFYVSATAGSISRTNSNSVAVTGSASWGIDYLLTVFVQGGPTWTDTMSTFSYESIPSGSGCSSGLYQSLTESATL